MKTLRWFTLAAPILTMACHDSILLGGDGGSTENATAQAQGGPIDASAPVADAGETHDASRAPDALEGLDAAFFPGDASPPGDAAGGPNVWAYGNPVDGGHVFGVNTNGGVVTLATGTSSQDVGLLVTQAGDTAYYVAEDSGDGGAYSYSLHAVPLQGGPSRTLASGLGEITAIAADTSYLYFGSLYSYDGGVAGGIQRVPVGGGTSEGVVGTGGPRINGVALAPGQQGQASSTTSVYWTQQDGANSGSVWWTEIYPAGPGYPMPLAQNQVSPSAIALDGRDVYWLNKGTMQVDCTPPDGALVEIPSGGSQPVVLLSSLHGARSLAVAGGQAYVSTAGAFCNAPSSTAGAVVRVSAAGGTTTLATALSAPDNLFVYGPFLYLTTVTDPLANVLGVSVLGR